MAKFTLMADGNIHIVGEAPSAELLEQLAGRIGADEAAVVVPAHDMSAFLEELVAGTSDADEAWEFMELLRKSGTGEPE